MESNSFVKSQENFSENLLEKLEEEDQTSVRELVIELAPLVIQRDYFWIAHLIHSLKIAEYNSLQQAVLNTVWSSPKYKHNPKLDQLLQIALYMILLTKDITVSFNKMCDSLGKSEITNNTSVENTADLLAHLQKTYG